MKQQVRLVLDADLVQRLKVEAAMMRWTLSDYVAFRCERPLSERMRTFLSRWHDRDQAREHRLLIGPSAARARPRT